MRKLFVICGALLTLTAVFSCVRGASTPQSIAGHINETVVARATTYEWMTYPGYSIEATPPNVSLPRVNKSDCGSLDLIACQNLYDCVRSGGKTGKCDQAYFANKTSPGKIGASGGVRPAQINPFWLQTTWRVDAGNTSTCASDGNNCSQSNCGAAGSNQGPCLTDGEMYARWATNSAPYAANVTITELSSALNADNPNIWDPVLLQQPPDSSPAAYTLIWQGNFTATTSTSVSATVAKVPSANTRFTATLVSAPTVNKLIQNTTHSSIAWTGFGTNVTRLTQPAAPVTLGINGAAIVPGAEVNTWAVSDTVTVNTLPFVPFLQVLPIQGGPSGFGTVVLYHMVLAEQVGHGLNGVQPGDDPIVVSNGVALVEDSIERGLNITNAPSQYTNVGQIDNCQIEGGIYGGALAAQYQNGSNLPSPYPISSGLVASINNVGTGAVSLQNVYLFNGTVMSSEAGSMTLNGYNYLGEVHLESNTAQNTLVILPGATADFSGGTANGNAASFQIGLLWGASATLDVRGNAYYAIATTAATTFPLPTIEILGRTAVCCATTANPSVMNCNITLGTTPLGAGACSAVTPALGNYAFLPGSGTFVGF